MDNIILIGNGFDLAHNHATSYRQFMLHYLNQSFKAAMKNAGNFTDELITIRSNNYRLPRVNQKIFSEIKEFIEYSRSNPTDLSITLHYKFLEQLLLNDNPNWVDIEHEYYKAIERKLFSDSYRTSVDTVESLNICFNHIKNKLHSYLSGLTYSKMKITNIQQELVDIYNDGSGKMLVVDFNYTNTALNYFNKTDVEYVQIHGALGKSDSIVFGYGDEMSESYKRIENMNVNEYLRYIKSFRYFETHNYSRIITFIFRSSQYNVHIMGHSCGISDRLLLNRIFTDEKCNIIEIHYHQRSPDKDDTDYFEKSQQISRHFPLDMRHTFRDKLLVKPVCKPLVKYSNQPKPTSE